MSLFSELKRRNVVRVAVAYIVAAWLLLQGIDFGLDVISAHNWIIQVITLLAVVGLPVVLVFSWVFEMTADGIKRESAIQQDASITAHTAKKLDKLTIAMLILVAVIVIADRFVPQTNQPASPTVAEQLPAEPKPVVLEPEPAPEVASVPSLAVLPFANMSSDPDNEYFSDGISEELLNLLVQVDGLRVPSRTSSFAFKGKNMDIKEIAKKLSVDHILEGSVRKAGNQVRITAQLIDVSTDTHIWSNTYDRELENIFAIQDEISREIIRELQIALDTSGLLSREESRPTSDMQAYQEFLRGRHLFQQRGIPPLKASLAVLQSAVARDPGFEQAWSALSLTAAVLSGWDLENQDTYNEIAISAGNRALEIDESSGIALTALGVVNWNMGIWDQSLIVLEQATAVSADSNPVYFRGLALQSTGYISEAREWFEKAESLDPVYSQIQYYLGVNAMLREDNDAARSHFLRSSEGNNSNSQVGMVWLELRLDNQQAAIRYIRELMALATAGEVVGVSAVDLETFIRAIEDPSLIAEAISASLDRNVLLWSASFATDDQIITALNRMYSEGKMLTISIGLANLLWSPEYSGVRATEDFKQLMRNLGIVDIWRVRGWPDLCHAVGDNDFECN